MTQLKVNRAFTASAPDQLWVADITTVKPHTGCVRRVHPGRVHPGVWWARQLGQYEAANASVLIAPGELHFQIVGSLAKQVNKDHEVV